jgi:inosine-uridine nucleoside N-ribohydrolase
MHRRSFVKFAGSTAMIIPAFDLYACNLALNSSNKTDLWIDADTANEIDDLYAITRALLEKKFNILGLSSGQWFHHLSPANTVQESQKINEDILRLMNRTDIPNPIGSNMIVGRPWGGREPRDSPAAQLMIDAAKKMPDDKKLIIANLGAVTNVASAILLDPAIIPKISVYCLSGKYFSDTGVWDKDEFNARRDLNALNVVFNTKGLDLHVMPVNILYDFKFTQKIMTEKLSDKGGIWDYLLARWKTHSPQSETWIFWDLALIEAIAHPEYVVEGQYFTPPENEQRKIHVYTQIDVEKMKAGWWNTIEGELK